MDVRILDENDNKVLKRKEIKFEVHGLKTSPSRKDLIKKIAALKNAKEENVIIGKILHKFGETKIKADARIYANKEDLKKIEVKPVVRVHFGVEKKAEVKKEETPAAAGKKEKKK
ncbi:MAG: hypothetical protein COT15_01630 [Candidatus Diapherotrites archaeon CG08_land_8_20_14_0_20_34_12]|nr:MAG: hypothetical protein COT15_01630 [Candidatus Diapherotrites archaeon CG08_land_8_20_14_0_20_34_12]